MIGYRILSDFSILASLSSISPSSQFPSVVRIRIRVINTRLYWPISVAGNTLSWIQRKIEFRDRGLFWINESRVIDITYPFVQIKFPRRNFFPFHPFLSYLRPSSIIAPRKYFTISLNSNSISRKYLFFYLLRYKFLEIKNYLLWMIEEERKSGGESSIKGWKIDDRGSQFVDNFSPGFSSLVRRNIIFVSLLDRSREFLRTTSLFSNGRNLSSNILSNIKRFSNRSIFFSIHFFFFFLFHISFQGRGYRCTNHLLTIFPLRFHAFTTRPDRNDETVEHCT